MENAEKEWVAGRSRGRIQENNKGNAPSGNKVKQKQKQQQKKTAVNQK